jgi:hypothetical protein
MNQNDETSRFTIRDEDDVPDYAADAENLRVEKLSTRITLVAVIIPCLLAIVLAIAYLDIKNRVNNTQYTGSVGVEKLSQDLESRFSSLSLKQAKIEQALAEQSKTLETATAALQINLKKTTAELKRLTESKPDQAALTALSKKTNADISALQKDIAELNAAFSKFDDELAAQIQLMAEGLKKDQGRLTQIEKKALRLDAEKLSKESMDLALGLERLGLKEMVKERIRAVEKKITDLSKKIDALNQRLDAQARTTSKPTPATAPQKPTAPSFPPATVPSGSNEILEQTID